MRTPGAALEFVEDGVAHVEGSAVTRARGEISLEEVCEATQCGDEYEADGSLPDELTIASDDAAIDDHAEYLRAGKVGHGCTQHREDG